ncbi:energy transducer TonB [Endozoicomonas sp. Mp262]|uniref:energy transducer TonB n=1 Tax=Endozoicomonas sp. Mp262 TaxID=2919499 RepID=UPI0021D947F6
MSRKLILTLLISLSAHVAAVMHFSQQEKQVERMNTGSIQAPVSLTFSVVTAPEIPKVSEEAKPEPHPQKILKKPLPKPQANSKPVLKKPEKHIEKKPEKVKPGKVKKQPEKKQEMPEQKQSIKTALVESKVDDLSDEPVLVSQPPIIHRVQPMYPNRYRRRNIESQVTLELLVNRQGEVIDIIILESSGYHQMDRSAILAVKQWRFKPEQRNGHFVQARFQVPVEFKINSA